MKTISADQQTATINRYLNETGTITNVDQAETIQTQADGSIVDTVASYGATVANRLLGTVTTTTSGNGLTKKTVYQNAAGSTVDTQNDTTTIDADGGTLRDCEDIDVVGTATLGSSVKTQTSANGQTKAVTMILSGALASAIAPNFKDVANTSIVIADTGVTTETTTDVINTATTVNDTTTVVTAANQRSKTTSTTLVGAAGAYIVQQDTLALDGSRTDTTTYYNPASLSLIEDQTTVNTSYDGRTMNMTKISDYDGTKYNVVTDTYVKNADFTTTEIRSGTGSFGAPAFKQVVTVATNADASHTTTTLNYDGSGTLVGQTVADVSANELVKSFAYDTTGLETISTLDMAAAALFTGAPLPASMLQTDIIESDATTLNTDGSKTEVLQTGYGNSFANLTNLRSRTTTATSANGLVTVTNIDNDGNGFAEQVDRTTRNPDGSTTSVYNYYDNAAAPSSSNLKETNTYTTSANGLVSVLTTSTGITDTRAEFANSNGSNQFSWNVASGSTAASQGFASGSASHDIDANGIDTWSWNDGSTGGSSGQITIDVATEKQDIAVANEIYMTLLGRGMDDPETQYLAHYINNGVLDRLGLAKAIVNKLNGEYQTNYYVVLSFNVSGIGTVAQELVTPIDVFAAFENALGRLPTAEEMGTFDQYMYLPTGSNLLGDDIAQMAVALAQYATDQGGTNNRTLIDPNQVLGSRVPSWISPAASARFIAASGAYNCTAQFLVDLNPTGTQVSSGKYAWSGVTATVNGNGNEIVAFPGSVLTLTGYNNAVETPGGSTTINASNTAIMIDSGASNTVSGNNDQITQVGPTTLTLTSGSSGDVIYVAALAGASGAASTTASNASITLGSGVGTAAAPDLVNGNGDTVSLTGSDYLTLNGTSDTINVVGSNDTINGGNAASGNDMAVFSGAEANYLISYNSATQTFTVADQRSGSPNGTTTVTGVQYFRFADGTFASSSFTVPVVTVPSANVSASPGQALQASSMFSARDPDGDTLTYYLYNNTVATTGGHFALNGTALPNDTMNPVTAAQLAQATFVAGAAGTSDDLYVKVYDGQVYTNWSEFHVSVPMVTVPSANVSASAGQALQASSLFSGSDPDGDTLTYYLYNNTVATTGGHFALNGTALPNDTMNPVTAAQLAQATFVAGAAGTSDDLYVKVYDGQVYTNWSEFHVSVPMVTVPSANVSASAGQALQASSLFSGSDLDGDTLTYYLYNNTVATTGGHFALNGTALPNDTMNPVTAAQLAQVTFVAGAAGTSDDLYVKLYDGHVYTNWSEFHVSVPKVTVPSANVSASAGQALQASSLFSGSDLDGDTLTYYLYDNTVATTGGHFALNGTALPNDTMNPVTAAQLAQATFVAGAVGTSDDLYVKVYDGHVYTSWSEFHVNVNSAPVILDLDGNGINLSLLGSSKATFDMTGDGQRVHTAWASAGDGFLAIDLGANGKAGSDGVIDQSKEIVFTEWAPGTTSDMQALRQVFDTNQDGKLDSGDARWSDFRIWQDANGNGISDPGEVKTLDQLGIQSIDLNPTGPAQNFADGSMIQGLSTYRRADGSTGVAADVTLAHSATTGAGVTLHDGGSAKSQDILSPTPGSIGPRGESYQPFVAASANMIDSQLNQLVQAMANRPTSDAGFDSIIASNAQLPNDQTPAIARSWH